LTVDVVDGAGVAFLALAAPLEPDGFRSWALTVVTPFLMYSFDVHGLPATALFAALSLAGAHVRTAREPSRDR
jgi:hypothetical protein